MKYNPLDTVKEIYRLYDAQLKTANMACRKYCADCCTTNVTMTRLEGLLITDVVSEKQISGRLSKNACDALPRYQPRLSTNTYIERCRSGEDPDDDQPGAQSGICPFLESGACTIYPVRPFGCRCMISKTTCSQNGYAEIDEVTLTMNTVFLQFIEHIDQKGFSGNMIDVLTCLTAKPDAISPDAISKDCRIIANRPISVLMVPPDQQREMQEIVTSLARLAERL